VPLTTVAHSRHTTCFGDGSPCPVVRVRRLVSMSKATSFQVARSAGGSVMPRSAANCLASAFVVSPPRHAALFL